MPMRPDLNMYLKPVPTVQEKRVSLPKSSPFASKIPMPSEPVRNGRKGRSVMNS